MALNDEELAQLKVQLQQLADQVVFAAQQKLTQDATIAKLLNAAQTTNRDLNLQVQAVTNMTAQIQQQDQVILNQQQAIGAITGGTATTPVTFNVNPFAGNINPNTQGGERLFSTTRKARAEADRIKPTHQNAKQFLKMMQKDAGEFAWG